MFVLNSPGFEHFNESNEYHDNLVYTPVSYVNLNYLLFVSVLVFSFCHNKASVPVPQMKNCHEICLLGTALVGTE